MRRQGVLIAGSVKSDPTLWINVRDLVSLTCGHCGQAHRHVAQGPAGTDFIVPGRISYYCKKCDGLVLHEIDRDLHWTSRTLYDGRSFSLDEQRALAEADRQLEDAAVVYEYEMAGDRGGGFFQTWDYTPLHKRPKGWERASLTLEVVEERAAEAAK